MASASLKVKKPLQLDVKLFWLCILSFTFLCYPRLFLYLPGVSPENQPLSFFGVAVTADQVSLPFSVRLPGLAILTILAMSFLLLQKLILKKIPVFFTILSLVYIISLFLSFSPESSLPENILERLSIVVVPLAISFAISREGFWSEHREQLIVSILTCAWLYMLVINLCSGTAVGMSGNRNWFASCFVVLSPWACLGLSKLLFKFTKKRQLSIFVPILFVLAVTLFYLYKAESRGAWLALILTMLFLTLKQFSLKGKGLIILSVVLVSIIVFSLNKPYFEKAYKADIRGPMWLANVEMILDRPLLGVGPGNFEKSYVPYKTVEHKIRKVAALSTEHPHNEFLLYAIESGLVNAVCWLLFILWLLSGRLVNREQSFAFLGASVLIFHSFFDKVLISPPGNLLFLLFLGVLLAAKLKGSFKIERHKPAFFYFGFFLALCFTYPLYQRVLNIVSAQALARKGRLVERGTLSAKSVEDYRKRYEEAYSLFMSANTQDPYKVKYPYFALNIAQEVLNDEEKVNESLGRVLELDSSFEHTSFFAGQSFLKMSSKTSDPILRQDYRNKARKFIWNEVRRHPFDFNGLNHCLESLIKAGTIDDANKLFSLQNKSIKSFYHFSKTDDEQLKLFWNTVLDNDKESLVIAQDILSGFKGTNFFDMALPALATNDGFFIQHDHQYFHNSDLIYWRAVQAFHEKTKIATDVESLIKLFAAKEVDRSLSFESPEVVFSESAVSPLTLASAVRYAAYMKGYLSFMVKVESLGKVHWLVAVTDGAKSFIFDSETKVVLEANLFKTLEDKKKLQEVLGVDVGELQIYLFDYPQAFSIRNVYLSKILSSNIEDIIDFCSQPSLVAMNIVNYLKQKYSVRFLREPFVEFEKRN